ncbi:MAG TPA: adenylate/guanylate cyclase domain-containing protein [Methylomirabilota bacterium]
MARAPRTVTTVLFTDIVGSTERAAELGDRGWLELLEDYHGRVRREIRRHGGRGVSTAGDGVLAAFDRPASAIRTAWAIREAVRELGLDIRAGLHTGEIETQGRDLGGIAVHIGARVAASAEPGEILVTSTVRELVTGTGLRFEDRGQRSLKGVPETWHLYALKGLPVGSDLAAGRWIPGLSKRRIRLAAGVATLALVGAAVWAATRGRDAPIGPEAALASGAAPGIAVVPFRVTDPSLEIWREGIVDLLSTNLDGLADLRAIDSRTVMARWGESAAADRDADLATSLEVAKRAGATYAVLGSTVPLGPDVRLTAKVYDLRTDLPIGEAQVEGSPDSVLMLVDRLSIGILQAILPEESARLARTPRLGSLTTTSLPALKAYLEGESLYRRSDFRAAIGAYERAVQADSTFGLAYFRLAEAWGWVEPGGQVGDNTAKALRHVDRLPPREATLVRANYAFLNGSNARRALELLTDMVRRYPDDAEAWYLMGETFLHLGPQILASGDGTQAFERAVALDPAFAPFQIHLLEEAFQSGDSAVAAERLRDYRRAAVNDPREASVGLAFAIAYEGPSARTRALAGLDTVPTRVLTDGAPLLFHPSHMEDAERLFEAGVRRLDVTASCARCLFWLRLREGKLRSALAMLGDSLTPWPDRSAGLYHLSLLGLRIPAGQVDAAASLRAEDTLSWLYSAAHAADRGRWPEHAAALGALRQAARAKGAEGDSVYARLYAGAARAAEGYGLWRRGDPRGALPLLESGGREVMGWDFAATWNRTIRWWTALVLKELGRPEDAGRYFDSLWHTHFWEDPHAAFELARILEANGEASEAVEAYDFAATAWREADREYAPKVRAARGSLSRLVGAGD